MYTSSCVAYAFTLIVFFPSIHFNSNSYSLTSSGLSNSFSKLSPLNSYSILFIPFEYDMFAYILLKSLSAVKLILGVPAYKSIFLLYAPVLFALSTAEIIILFSSASLSGIVAFIVFESVLSVISVSAAPLIE